MFHIHWTLYDIAVECKFQVVGHFICANQKSEQKLDTLKLSSSIFFFMILVCMNAYVKERAAERVCFCSSYTKPNLFGLCLMECGGNLNKGSNNF